MKPPDLPDVGPIFLGLGFAALVFCAVVHPVWCMIDCALSETRSPTFKIMWIIALFFVSCVAGVFYGLLAARSPRLRTATVGSLLIMILCVPAFLYVEFHRILNSPPPPTSAQPAQSHKVKNKVKKAIPKPKKKVKKI